MRRIIAFNNVSADGYFAAPDGSLNWVVPDEAMDQHNAAATKRGGVDTLLFGRKTYQMFASFWPTVVDEDPHAPGKHSAEMRAMAEMLNETPKIVFSRSLKEAKWEKTQIVRELDPRWIEQLKGERGEDMMIFGSGSIVSVLARHRLVDELQYAVNPVVLGAGRMLINTGALGYGVDLAEEKRFPTGKLLLRYTLAPLAEGAKPEPERPPTRAAKKSAKKAPQPTARAAGAEFLHADAALAKIVGNLPMSRSQAMNKLLSYIKRKGLQDKQNRRLVNPNDALRAVVGKAQVSVNDLQGIVDKHLK